MEVICAKNFIRYTYNYDYKNNYNNIHYISLKRISFYHQKYWNTIPLFFHFCIPSKSNVLIQITTTIMTITEIKPEAVATVINIYIMKKYIRNQIEC